MLGFSSLWRRKDDSPTLPSTAKQGGRIDKAVIGRPVLRTIPLRFEKYAGDYTRGPRSRSSSHRSGTSSRPSLQRPDRSSPAARSPPPESDKSSYPVIRSYSLPAPVCPPLNGTANGHEHFASPPGVTGRANSCSPLHLDIRRPLSPIQEQSYSSPLSLKPTSPLCEDDISALDLSRTFLARSGFLSEN